MCTVFLTGMIPWDDALYCTHCNPQCSKMINSPDDATSIAAPTGGIWHTRLNSQHRKRYSPRLAYISHSIQNNHLQLPSFPAQVPNSSWKVGSLCPSTLLYCLYVTQPPSGLVYDLTRLRGKCEGRCCCQRNCRCRGVVEKPPWHHGREARDEAVVRSVTRQAHDEVGQREGRKVRMGKVETDSEPGVMHAHIRPG